MAILATDEDDLRDALLADLRCVGLHLLEFDEIRGIDIDDHLADNIRNWETGKRTVWGTIYVYLASGEA